MQNGDSITFELDGLEVKATADETIWQVANRHQNQLPHLCYLPQPGYRADGNCRACMVEIEGERVLAASCIRKPAQGMKVKTDTERAEFARKTVFEMLAVDQPDKDKAHDPESRFWQWADRLQPPVNRMPERSSPEPIAAIRQWVFTSMPAFIVTFVCAPVARYRSMTSLVWLTGDMSQK